jgi:hypothetical protein
MCYIVLGCSDCSDPVTGVGRHPAEGLAPLVAVCRANRDRETGSLEKVDGSELAMQSREKSEPN